MPVGLKPWHLILLASGIALISFVGPPQCPEPGCASIEDMHVQQSGLGMYRLMMPTFIIGILGLALGFLLRKP